MLCAVETAKEHASLAFARPAFLEQTPVMGFCKLEQVIPLASREWVCLRLYARASACVEEKRHRFTVNPREFF